MVTTTTGLATSYINFSRASLATVTNNVGNIAWAGHNLLTNSESFDSSSWFKSGTTVTANATAAPNGTTTAEAVFETAANVVHYIDVASPGTAAIVGATYTRSVFLKANGRQWVAINFYDNASNITWFDIQNGVVGTNAAGTTASITAIGSGWFLCSVTRTAAATPIYGAVQSTTADNVSSAFAGDVTKGFYIWGASLFRSDLGGMVFNPAMPAGMGTYYPTTPRNLLGYTEDFSQWTKVRSTVSTNTTIAPNGLQTADTVIEDTGAGTTHYIRQAVTTGAGPQVYSVHVRAKERSWINLVVTTLTSVSAYFDLINGVTGTVGANCTATITSAGNGWYRCAIYFTSTAASQNIDLQIATANGGAAYTGDGTSGIYIWGAQLSDSASIDPYTPVYGAAVTSAAYYAPRLDYSPTTIQPLGLLVEEQRTNVLQRSQELSTSPWAANQSSVSASGTAPDGVSTSFLLSSSGSFPALSQSVSGSGTITFSAYVKDGTSGQVIFRVTGADIGGAGNTETVYRFIFSTATFARVQGGTGTTTVQALSNSWYRISLTLTTTTYSAVVFYPRWSDATAANVLLWGAQLEAGNFSTSYIPTGASQVTRALDVASVNTQAFPYSASEGTLVASGSFISLTSTSVAVMASLSNNASSNSINIYRQSAAMQLNTFASGSAGPAYVVAASTDPVKAAFAYKLNDMNAAVNGVAQTTNTTAALPTGVTRLDIGSMWNVDYKGAGWIRQITYIPRRLSNADLQTRTT